MGDRQRRREGAAVDIEDDLRRAALLRARRQIAQEQPESCQGAGDPEMLRARIELCGIAVDNRRSVRPHRHLKSRTLSSPGYGATRWTMSKANGSASGEVCATAARAIETAA